MQKKRLFMAAAATLFVGSTAVAGPLGLVDDFNTSGLSDYTRTVILDANGGAANVASFEDNTGVLQHITTSYDGIEQTAFIRNGLTLEVGEELGADFSVTGSQDLGLYVGGTTPTAGVRQDYVAVYARGDGALYSRGFDGTTEYALAGGVTPTYDSLFIARTDTNTYELGYYDNGTRNIITTRTPTTANEGDVVGFYTDVRAAGTLEFADNLQITLIPEPTSLTALGGLGLLALRRRK